ncbi:peroxidase [Ranunculus cassubicifolius]
MESPVQDQEQVPNPPRVVQWKHISAIVSGATFIVIAIALVSFLLPSRNHKNGGEAVAPCSFDVSNNGFMCSLNNNSGLEYNFYRKSCPEAELIVRSKVQTLYEHNSSVAPALIRLVFHDCFIGGCDASVLLDGNVGIKSEKDVIPNLTLKGFDTIDSIKERLEEAFKYVLKVILSDPSITSRS